MADEAAANEIIAISLTDEEKIEYLTYVHRQLIKLLSLIEADREGGASAHAFFGGFLFDMNSADWLFNNRMSPILVKLNGLYAEEAYRTANMQTVRNKIFESRGIIEGLIRELGGKEPPKKRRR